MSTIERPDWRDRAACRGMPGDLFFPPEDEGPAACAMRERAARSVCAHCPVTGPCTAEAITTGDRWSISGGLNPAERTALRRATARITQGQRQRAAVEAAGKKTCTQCQLMLPLTMFGTDGPGYRGNCKTCRNTKVRQRRQEAS